jgi:hypothetical protein
LPAFSAELSLSAERSLRAGFADAARLAACKSLIAVTRAAFGIFTAPSIPSWTPTLRSSGRSIALRSLAGLRARVEVSVTFPHSWYLVIWLFGLLKLNKHSWIVNRFGYS